MSGRVGLSSLVALPGGSFRLWPWACVRSAGFPANWALELGSERLAQSTRLAPGPVALETRLAPGAVALASGAPVGADFRQLFDAETQRVQTLLRRVATNEAFREAIGWQNPSALTTGIDFLLRQPTERRDSEVRKNEQLVAKYLQRYCLKNDTIGYFGPHAWAGIAPATAAFEVTVGPSLLRRRAVYLEAWAVRALARQIVAQLPVRPWLCPRRHPLITVHDGVAHSPSGRPIRLTPLHEQLLLGATGNVSARELVAWELPSRAGARANPTGEVPFEKARWEALDELWRRGLILWDLDPPSTVGATRVLRTALGAIGDAKLRAAALGMLNELDGCRSALQQAAGDAEQVRRSMATLGEVFGRLTGRPAKRKSGRTYAARTPVYEDCERALDVVVGSALLERVGPALSLVLTAGQWCLHELATRYRVAFHELFARLAPPDRPAPVPLPLFWAEVHRFPWFDPRLRVEPPLVGDVMAESRLRWERLLAHGPEERRIARSSAELRPAVQACFDTPGPGWPAARLQTVDLMLDAPSTVALHRGQCRFVLNELHLSNALCSSYWEMHHRPDELQAALDESAVGRWVVLLHNPLQRLVEPAPSGSLYVDVGAAPCDASPAQIMPASAFVVDREGAELVVRATDGSTQVEVAHFFGQLLTRALAERFSLTRPGRHRPRITIDELVVQREQWVRATRELDFVRLTDTAERFRAAARWAEREGIAPQCFVKLTVEADFYHELKPYYLDFSSPVLVEILCRLVRGARQRGLDGARLAFTELLPRPDGLWLEDAQGERYTSELRLVTVAAER